MAEGWVVRNASEGSAVAERGAEAERRDFSCVMVAALRVCVFRSARFSLRVSCTLCRRARMDSGVGWLDGRGSSRP